MAQPRWRPALRDSIRTAFGLEEDDVEDTVNGLASSIADGRFKFVVLMDQVTPRLKDLILFLNEKSAFDLYAVEMERYRHAGFEIVIPRLFGAEVRKGRASGPAAPRVRANEQAFLDEAAKLSPAEREAVTKLYFVSKELASDINFGRGQPAISPKFARASERSFYTLRANGYLSINLAWHDDPTSGPGAAEYRDRFKEALRGGGLEIPDTMFPGFVIDAWAVKTEGIARAVRVALAQQD